MRLRLYGLLALAALPVLALAFTLWQGVRAPTPPPEAHMTLPSGPPAPELTGGGAWLNSEPLTLAELRGKVVLIDFWTYG